MPSDACLMLLLYEEAHKNHRDFIDANCGDPFLSLYFAGIRGKSWLKRFTVVCEVRHIVLSWACSEAWHDLQGKSASIFRLKPELILNTTAMVGINFPLCPCGSVFVSVKT